MDDRIAETEKQVIARGRKIAFAERMFWMICTGAVGLAFIYLRLLSGFKLERYASSLYLIRSRMLKF